MHTPTRSHRPLGLVIAIAFLATLLTPGSLARAQTEVDYTPDQFNRLFDGAPLEGLAPLGSAPSITGDAEVDARIRAIAEAREYRRPHRALGDS